MNLNLRINEYTVALDNELNIKELQNHGFNKVGFFSRLKIKPKRNEIIWWSKNCDLKYSNDDFRNSIIPNLNIKGGSEFMFGTSAYLWFRENKLIKFSFQIINNKMVAEIELKRLEEKVINIVGKPTLSMPLSKTWNKGNQELIIEYPQRKNGYIHLKQITGIL